MISSEIKTKENFMTNMVKKAPRTEALPEVVVWTIFSACSWAAAEEEVLQAKSR
jgi:hypothetical protein